MAFPRQEDWNGLPFPSSGDLPDPGKESASPALVGEFFTDKHYADVDILYQLAERLSPQCTGA